MGTAVTIGESDALVYRISSNALPAVDATIGALARVGRRLLVRACSVVGVGGRIVGGLNMKRRACTRPWYRYSYSYCSVYTALSKAP